MRGEGERDFKIHILSQVPWHTHIIHHSGSQGWRTTISLKPVRTIIVKPCLKKKKKGEEERGEPD